MIPSEIYIYIFNTFLISILDVFEYANILGM